MHLGNWKILAFNRIHKGFWTSRTEFYSKLFYFTSLLVLTSFHPLKLFTWSPFTVNNEFLTTNSYQYVFKTHSNCFLFCLHKTVLHICIIVLIFDTLYTKNVCNQHIYPPHMLLLPFFINIIIFYFFFTTTTTTPSKKKRSKITLLLFLRINLIFY